MQLQSAIVFIESTSYERDLTLIAGLAGEARVALALIGSHAVSVLTSRLAHSCSGRLKEEETDQCSVLADDLFQIRMTKLLIRLLVDLAVNYLFTSHYSDNTE